MVEHRPLSDIIAYAILTLGVFIVAFPVYLALIASTHDAATVVGGHMPLTPGSHTLENYYRADLRRRLAHQPRAGRHMLINSFISAIGIAVGKIFISILSAYAVVYFRFPFRMTAFWIIFITLMLPVEVRIYPTYKVVADLHMLDTYAGLILPLIASATGTLLFRQFFMTVPEELLEASQIDGAGPFRFFWDTLLPLSVTTIAALFVIQFIYGWNQYLWPLLITTQDSMQTIVIGIKKMLVDARTTRRMAARDGDRGARHAAAGRGRRVHAAAVRARPGRDGKVRPWPTSRCATSARPMPAASKPSRASTSMSATASSACWSAPPAAASPRCCAWSRGSRPSPAARSISAAASSTRSSRPSATSRWCSRTTRSIRI